MAQASVTPRRAKENMPMPAHIAPMLAVLADLPVDEDRWSFEYKWDGVRAICYWDGRALRLESRNLLDVTARYPELQSLGAALGARQRVILDGEIVALDDAGRPSFAQLQRRMHLSGGAAIARTAREIPAYYMIFDLLYLRDRLTMDLPVERRRELLQQVMVAGPSWRLSPASVGEGAALLGSARQHRMEGVVAKRLDSPYLPGRRSPAWRKIKIVGRQEFVVGGWMPQVGDRRRVGSLLLGYHGCDGKLCYAGRVGSGFSDETHGELVKLLEARRTPRSPFVGSEEIPRNALFVRPELVVEVEYRRWPKDGFVQQAAFKGVRSDKRAEEVVRELPSG